MREGVVVPVAEFTGEMRNGALLSSRYLFDSLRGTTNPGMDGRKKKNKAAWEKYVLDIYRDGHVAQGPGCRMGISFA